MSQELNLRQKAIRWKQAGRAVSWICQRLERNENGFTNGGTAIKRKEPAGCATARMLQKTIRIVGRAKRVRQSWIFAIG